MVALLSQFDLLRTWPQLQTSSLSLLMLQQPWTLAELPRAARRFFRREWPRSGGGAGSI